jgi:hypothetical protein
VLTTVANRFRPMLLFTREHALKLGNGRIGGIGRNPAHGRSHRDFFCALPACDLGVRLGQARWEFGIILGSGRSPQELDSR